MRVIRTEEACENFTIHPIGRVYIVGFGTVFLLFTLLMGGMLARDAWIDAQIRSSGRALPAEITGFDEDNSGEGVSYKIRYTFQPPVGRQIRDEVSVEKEQIDRLLAIPPGQERFYGAGGVRLPKGIPATVEYLPQDASRHRLRGFAYHNMTGSPIVGVVVILLFVGVSAALIWFGIKAGRPNS